MAAQKLSALDQIVANVAASAFPKVKAAKVVRSTLWSLAKVALLLVATQETSGWVDVGLYIFAARLVFGFFFIGVAQRAIDERHARLRLLPVQYRNALTTKSVLYSKEGAR